MIALPSPLGFGFFAFGVFEQLLKKKGRKPKSLRTMIERVIGGDLASVAVRPARTPGHLLSFLFCFRTHITFHLASNTKAPFNLGGIFQ